MRSQEARPGMVVRVREDYRKPELEGMLGIIEQRWGNPDYSALDVRLEDGSSELFWFHQLDVVEDKPLLPASTAYYDGG